MSDNNINLRSLDPIKISDLESTDKYNDSSDFLLISQKIESETDSNDNSSQYKSKKIKIGNIVKQLTDNALDNLEINIDDLLKISDFDSISNKISADINDIRNNVENNSINIDQICSYISNTISTKIDVLSDSIDNHDDKLDKLSTDISNILIDVNIPSDFDKILNIAKIIKRDTTNNSRTDSELSINIPYATEDEDGIITKNDKKILNEINLIGTPKNEPQQDTSEEDTSEEDSDEPVLTFNSKIHILSTDSTEINETASYLTPGINYIHATKSNDDKGNIDDDNTIPEEPQEDISILKNDNSTQYIFSTEVEKENTVNKRIVGISYQSMLNDIYSRIKTMLTNDIKYDVEQKVENTFNNSEIINNITNKYGSEDNMIDISQFKHIKSKIYTFSNSELQLNLSHKEFEIPIYQNQLLHINIVITNKHINCTLANKQEAYKIQIINRRWLYDGTQEEDYIIDEEAYNIPNSYFPTTTFNFDKYIDIKIDDITRFKKNLYIIKIFSDQTQTISNVFDYVKVITTQYSNENEIIDSFEADVQTNFIKEGCFASQLFNVNSKGKLTLTFPSNIRNFINIEPTNSPLVDVNGYQRLAIPLQQNMELAHFWINVNNQTDANTQPLVYKDILKFPTYEYLRDGSQHLHDLIKTDKINILTNKDLSAKVLTAKVYTNLINKYLFSYFGQKNINSNKNMENVGVQCSTRFLLNDTNSRKLMIDLQYLNSHPLSTTEKFKELTSYILPGKYIKTFYEESCDTYLPQTTNWNGTFSVKASDQVNLNLKIELSSFQTLFNNYIHPTYPVTLDPLTLKYNTTVKANKPLTAIYGITFNTSFRGQQTTPPHLSVSVDKSISALLTSNTTDDIVINNNNYFTFNGKTANSKFLPAEHICIDPDKYEQYPNIQKLALSVLKTSSTNFGDRNNINLTAMNDLFTKNYIPLKDVNVTNYASPLNNKLFADLRSIRNDTNNLNTCIAYLIKESNNKLGFDFVYNVDNDISNVISIDLSHTSTLTCNISSDDMTNDKYAILLSRQNSLTKKFNISQTFEPEKTNKTVFSYIKRNIDTDNSKYKRFCYYTFDAEKNTPAYDENDHMSKKIGAVPRNENNTALNELNKDVNFYGGSQLNYLAGLNGKFTSELDKSPVFMSESPQNYSSNDGNQSEMFIIVYGAVSHQFSVANFPYQGINIDPSSTNPRLTIDIKQNLSADTLINFITNYNGNPSSTDLSALDGYLEELTSDTTNTDRYTLDIGSLSSYILTGLNPRYVTIIHIKYNNSILDDLNYKFKSSEITHYLNDKYETSYDVNNIFYKSYALIQQYNIQNNNEVIHYVI